MWVAVLDIYLKNLSTELYQHQDHLQQSIKNPGKSNDEFLGKQGVIGDAALLYTWEKFSCHDFQGLLLYLYMEPIHKSVSTVGIKFNCARKKMRKAESLVAMGTIRY